MVLKKSKLVDFGKGEKEGAEGLVRKSLANTSGNSDRASLFLYFYVYLSKKECDHCLVFNLLDCIS
jgi:hypothetical protein